VTRPALIANAFVALLVMPGLVVAAGYAVLAWRRTRSAQLEQHGWRGA
jgi:hypothetical protein